MKVESHRLASVLADPGRLRAILLFGDDAGLIRERGRALSVAVTGSANDPFRMAELNRDEWDRLPEEASAQSLLGGRRVVRVRDATDAILPTLTRALAGPASGLIVVEAAGLGKGRLRSYAEASADVGVIGCYPAEGRARRDLIADLLRAGGISAEAAALDWLDGALPLDRGALSREVEKLVLHGGDAGRLDVETAMLCCGDAAEMFADEAILAALCGDRVAADHATERALADPAGAIGTLRIALNVLLRLHQARRAMACGTDADTALRGLRPPVFYRSIPVMSRALRRWSEAGLIAAIEAARQTEMRCKRTGARQDLAVHAFIGAIARRG